MTNDVENLFMHLFAICVFSLGHCSDLFPIFLTEGFAFLLAFKTSMYILDTNP